jgi:hypothetical protein
VRYAVAILTLLFFGCGSNTSIESIDSSAGDTPIIDTVFADTLSRQKPRPVFSDTSMFPPGYIIMDSVYGDLNLDPFTDAVFVFGHASETEGATYSERPRVLMIFLGDSSGFLNRVVRNDYVVYTEVDGQMFGESFAGCEIDSGTLRVNHYGGSRFRWTADYLFEYNSEKKSWFYTRSYASMGDMLGEMNDLTETGQCIPYATDTLIVKKPIDIRKFDNRTAPVAATTE